MKTLRKAVGLSVLFLLLFLSACGVGLPPKRRCTRMIMKKLPLLLKRLQCLSRS